MRNRLPVLSWLVVGLACLTVCPAAALGAAATPPTYAGEFTSFAQQNNGYHGPEGVSRADGDVLVADTANNQMVELAPDGSVLTGPWGSAFLNKPRQAVLLGDEWIVSDSFDLARVNPATGEHDGSFASLPGSSPLIRGIAVDAQGDRVAVADAGDSEVDVYDADGNLLQRLTSANGIDLSGPEAVAFDAQKRLIVGDNNNHRVVGFDSDGNWFEAFAGPSGMVPTGVTVDQGNGNIWVADYANSELEEFDAGGTLLQTVSGGGPSESLSHPVTDELDPASGDLYVADTGNNRVVRYTGAGTTGNATSSSTTSSSSTTTSSTSSSSTSSSTSSGGKSVSFTLRNPSGTPQFAYYIVEPVGHAAPSAGDWGSAASTTTPGQVTLDVTPGQTVYFNRTTNVDQSGPNGALTPPEGVGGQPYAVDETTPSAVTVTLPSAGTTYNPTLSAPERWMIGQLNQRRVAAGHSPLTISTTLDAAAGVEARDEAVNHRWPDPYTFVIPQDQGWPGDIWDDFTEADAPFSDPQRVLAHWDGDPSDSESANIWQALNDPYLKYVGIADGDGAWIIQGTYACPSTSDATACGITTDQGDPNAWSPTTTTTSTTTTTGATSSQTATGTAPVAQTQGPSFVSSDTINLAGHISSTGGLDTHYYFQYGPDLDHMPNDVPAYPGRDIGNAGSYTAAESLTGLSPNTTVCFRLVAYNSAGTTYAHDASSGDPGTNRGQCTQTSGPPSAPRVTTGATTPFVDATHGTGTAENLNGTVNPENQSTTFFFQYSVHPDLTGAGDRLSATVAGEVPTRDPGADVYPTGTAPVNVGALASGLKPGTRYYYRLVGRNGAGATYGSVDSFVSDPGSVSINGGLEDSDGNALRSDHVAENSGVKVFWYCSTRVAGTAGVASCSVSGATSSHSQAGTVTLPTGKPGTYTIRVDETSVSGATGSQRFTFTVDAPPASSKVQRTDQQNADSSTYQLEHQAAAAGLCQFVYDHRKEAGVFCPSALAGVGGELYAASGYDAVSGPFKVGSTGSLISDKGLGVINAGAGNVIAAGAGNVINAGAGNVINAGAGNVVVLVKAGVIAAGAGNVINAGAYNLIAGNEANVIAAGAHNLIAGNPTALISDKGLGVIAAGAGNLINLAALDGGSFGPASAAIAGIAPSNSLVPGTQNALIATNDAAVIAAGAGNVINAGAYNGPNVPLASTARAGKSHKAKTVSLATGRITFTRGGQKLGMLISYTAAGRKVIAAIRAANLKRLKRHQHHLLSLRMTITETFTPKGHGKKVTVTKVFTVTPGKSALSKKKKK